MRENAFSALLISLTIVLALAVSSSPAFAITSHEITYPASSGNQISNANLIVKVLKYEPYPVNAGDWFDLWIKVENIGQNDASGATFELSPQYPFSSNDSLIQEYGTLLGVAGAYKVGMESDANQVILKYRVKVADNAPDGISDIKFITHFDSSAGSGVDLRYDLPISIEKTKTDFDIVMQDITPTGTSFMITNIGQNMAHAVTLTLEDTDNTLSLGTESIVIGDLDKGDFTISHLNAIPKDNVKSLSLKISYTDDSGIRNTQTKEIQINSPTNINAICQDSSASSYSNIIIGSVGFVIGAFVIFLLFFFLKKK